MINRKNLVLDENFREFIELLNSKKVKYMVVGGYAVGLYGYPRYTGDLDVWIKPNLENSKKVFEVLKAFGFGSLDINAESFLKEDLVHQFGYPPLRIDVLTGISGLTFEQSYRRKKKMIVDGVAVNVVHLDDLKYNKIKSGRPEDFYDVKKLEQVKQNVKKTGKRKS
ncbi:MAG: nucleotidyltransferase [Bacteroidota bacterium]